MPFNILPSQAVLNFLCFQTIAILNTLEIKEQIIKIASLHNSASYGIDAIDKSALLVLP